MQTVRTVCSVCTCVSYTSPVRVLSFLSYLFFQFYYQAIATTVHAYLVCRYIMLPVQSAAGKSRVNNFSGFLSCCLNPCYPFSNCIILLQVKSCYAQQTNR